MVINPIFYLLYSDEDCNINNMVVIAISCKDF